MNTCIFPFIHALKIRKVQSFVLAFVCGSIETKGMPAWIRTILNPPIFLSGFAWTGHLKALWRAVSVSGFTGFVWTEGRFVWKSARFKKYPDPCYPGYQRFFLACGGNFRCWPKADTSLAVGRSHERRSRRKTLRAGHYKDLTETGNRPRKVSGI